MSYHKPSRLLSHFARSWAAGEGMYSTPASYTIAISLILHQLSGKICGFVEISESLAEKEIKLFQFGLVGSHPVWKQAS